MIFISPEFLCDELAFWRSGHVAFLIGDSEAELRDFREWTQLPGRWKNVDDDGNLVSYYVPTYWRQRILAAGAVELNWYEFKRKVKDVCFNQTRRSCPASPENSR